jgi:hypothetical protein
MPKKAIARVEMIWESCILSVWFVGRSDVSDKSAASDDGHDVKDEATSSLYIYIADPA